MPVSSSYCGWLTNEKYILVFGNSPSWEGWIIWDTATPCNLYRMDVGAKLCLDGLVMNESMKIKQDLQWTCHTWIMWKAGRNLASKRRWKSGGHWDTLRTQSSTLEYGKVSRDTWFWENGPGGSDYTIIPGTSLGAWPWPPPQLYTIKVVFFFPHKE